MEYALTHLRYRSSHQALIHSANVLKQSFKEVDRRTRVMKILPEETSATSILTVETMLRSSVAWC
jgi:transposase-like protein